MTKFITKLSFSKLFAKFFANTTLVHCGFYYLLNDNLLSLFLTTPLLFLKFRLGELAERHCAQEFLIDAQGCKYVGKDKQKKIYIHLTF